MTKKEEDLLEVELKDGTSALIKNVSAEVLMAFRQWAPRTVLEACRGNRFFDIRVTEIQSWKEMKT